MDTLPTAVAFADAHPENTYTIQFRRGVSGVINLASGAGTLDLTSNITINGPVNHSITIAGGATPGSGANVQVFDISSGVTVTLTNLVISNGYQPTVRDDVGGGGIYNAGTLTLTGDVFSGNTANVGAGLYNAGVVTMNDCMFTRGDAYAGAGIFNTGTATVWHSSFINNAASASGGGVYNTGAMAMASDIFFGNSAADGGAIENDHDLTLRNVVFLNNHADYGGAIFNDGNLTRAHVLFFGNSAQGGDNIYEPS